MKCDNCDNEATVHEVMIKGGKKVEKHLCEQCAMSQGVGVQVAAPITKLLTQYVTAQSQRGQAQAAASPACPTCGLAYGQFRKSGLLGCPACYEAFEAQLGPLLARAHEGGVHHVGKTPRAAQALGRAGGSGQTAGPTGRPEAGGTGMDAGAQRKRIETLQRRLAEAIAAEQYERAAKLRDELEQLGAAAPGSGGPAGPAPAGDEPPGEADDE